MAFPATSPRTSERDTSAAVGDLRGVGPDEALELRGAGVHTVDQLLDAASDLAALESRSGVPAPRLAEILADHCEAAATKTAKQTWRHLEGYGWHLALVASLALAGLAAGRLVVRPVMALVPEPKSPTAPAVPKDRVVLTVRLAAPPVSPAKPPFRATIHASSSVTPPQPPLRVADALVLALHDDAEETTADVALKPADADALGAVLGTSHVYVSHSPPPNGRVP